MRKSVMSTNKLNLQPNYKKITNAQNNKLATTIHF